MAKLLRTEKVIGRLLAGSGLKLAVAESCTGGLIGHRITSIAGSSDYFAGGVIAYSNEVKVRVLGVQRAVLSKHGAVSGQVALQMAEGVMRLTGTDVAVAVTGVAGPGGGSVKKPVGLVFIAVAGGGGRKQVRRFRFSGSRAQVKMAASQAALGMLIDLLSIIEKKGGC